VRTTTTTAYIGLGSNLGDRAGNLLAAVRCLIEADFEVHALSGVYETEPIDIETDLEFLNMVAEIRVRDVRPTQMMARLLRIEYVLGRRDKVEKRPRTIDLDLLYYGKEVMKTDFLTLPHPRLHLRKFVLVPLNEIAPQLVHPTLHKEIRQLLDDCDDISYVERWNPNSAHHESLILNS
jgi:2-amino-4-hydroxy-6-hydroxymethyldihydropteridine diphosphokinase